MEAQTHFLSLLKLRSLQVQFHGWSLKLKTQGPVVVLLHYVLKVFSEYLLVEDMFLYLPREILFVIWLWVAKKRSFVKVRGTVV
jgi:hypothetical protein